jgi:hypothetical protein
MSRALKSLFDDLSLEIDKIQLIYSILQSLANPFISFEDKDKLKIILTMTATKALLRKDN